jgi:hypothetical protein
VSFAPRQVFEKLGVPIIRDCVLDRLAQVPLAEIDVATVVLEPVLLTERATVHELVPQNRELDEPPADVSHVG